MHVHMFCLQDASGSILDAMELNEGAPVGSGGATENAPAPTVTTLPCTGRTGFSKHA